MKSNHGGEARLFDEAGSSYSINRYLLPTRQEPLPGTQWRKHRELIIDGDIRVFHRMNEISSELSS